MAKLEQEFKIISPKLAIKYLEENAFEGQPPVKDWHVMRLAANIMTGYWRRGSQIEFAVLPNGRMIQIDGTHRLWAVVESGKPTHFSILYSPVANHTEVAELFALHNQMQLTRGSTEIAKAAKELYDIENVVARQGINATKCIAAGLRHFTATTDPIIATDPMTIMQNLDAWIGELRLYADMRKTADPRGKAFFSNRWALAVCLIAIRYYKDKGIDFTKRILSDEAPKGCPTRILLTWAFPTSRVLKRMPLEFLPATCQAFDMFIKNKKSSGRLGVPLSKTGWIKDTPYTLDRVIKTEMNKLRKGKKKSTVIKGSAHDPHSGRFAT